MKILTGIASGLLGLGALPLLAQTSDGFGRYGHPHMSGWGHDGGWMLLGPLFMLLLLAALVIGIVALVRWVGAGSGSGPNQDTSSQALATLNQRFAKGEIDAKEYAERKALLQG